MSVDTNAWPRWMRTGYKYFPYAAQQAGRWWVLRFNVGFPEHDMYTMFVDNKAAGDVTGNANSSVALIASIGALNPSRPQEAMMDAATARAVVDGVARFVDYGSEHGQPCAFCSDDRDALTLGQPP
ncbi:hypothetical protein E3G68_005241 [Mycobacteroides abscessus]|uniref:hypothetical protein n=1 Tax=Mycobacteroides abscessus TaxID=36809 RepID=UPI001C6B759E|nr:hypothetical protein [Mycobacteroides abscessus]